MVQKLLMENNKALVKLYMLQLQHTAMFLSLSNKMSYILRNQGVSESSILEIDKEGQSIVEGLLKSQIQKWKPFLEGLASDDDFFSSMTFDDLMN